MEKVRLGLIGDNIAASRAPRLHAIAGRMRGVEISLLVPAEQDAGFDELLERCASATYHGLNITHPYSLLDVMRSVADDVPASVFVGGSMHPKISEAFRKLPASRRGGPLDVIVVYRSHDDADHAQVSHDYRSTGHGFGRQDARDPLSQS